MNPLLGKILNFVTGGLPAEIGETVRTYIGGKNEKEIKQFMGDLSYDLEVLAVTKGDKLFTRQGIAWTFHLFMWLTKLITGSFPQDIIFTWGGTEITVGFIYVLIIAFYFPFRAIEKWKKNFVG